MDYLLAIDQGTTGTTAAVMDTGLNVVAAASEDFSQHFPQPGWVEHDLNDIWSTVVRTVGQVTGKIDPTKIAAIGITNQRETLGFWDRRDGLPLAHAIVWQDRRTAAICERLKKRKAEPVVQKNTGLLLDPYFSGTKAAWALEHWPQVKSAACQGYLAVGTMDSYLIARLSGAQAHVTEPSNASRTLIFHLTKHHWDDQLAGLLGVPLNIWPNVHPSVGIFAKTKGVPGLPDGIPITGVLGDQQAALLGQACVELGAAKCTYGTGAFLLLNAGSKPPVSRHRLLTTVAWALDEKNYTYALEGSAFIAGAAVQWLRDGLGIIKTAAEVEELAGTVSSSEGVVFVPALTGLGAPYWNPNARGMFSGLTRGTTKGHLARAVLEGIAFQIADILTAMSKDLKKPIRRLNVDGGAAANNVLMQFQADILAVELRRPKNLETTSLGAIFAAGLGIGLWKTPADVAKAWQMDRVFRPHLKERERQSALKYWHQAIARIN